MAVAGGKSGVERKKDTAYLLLLLMLVVVALLLGEKIQLWLSVPQ